VRHPRSDHHLVLANGRVLLGLVTTRPSHAGDGAAESVMATACCRRQIMQVTTLPSHAGIGGAESVLVVA
jgi:hypothetical protein